MASESIHEALTPLKWLIGSWKSMKAEGFYPTIKPFTYCEELTFTSSGQPCLNYYSRTWHPEKGFAMHLESGFLRIKPGSDVVSFMVAHNFGLTSLEEGTVTGTTLHLKSSNISRMQFAKDPSVKQIERCYKLDDVGKLEFSLLMATTNTDLDEHLKVVYERVL